MINPEDDIEFLANSDDDEDSLRDDEDPDSNGKERDSLDFSDSHAY